MRFKDRKRGQVTIFIIAAIIIVMAGASYFIFKDNIQKENIPPLIEPIESSFLSCLNDYSLSGVSILKTNGGNIESLDFDPGSRYSPFSSHLNFMGENIPYWYYISGNNLQKEQVPSKSDMEIQLQNFIEKQILSCQFDEYFDQGFQIIQGVPEVKVKINEDYVDIDLGMDLAISKEEFSYIIENHNIRITTKLGGLYDEAKKVYEQEMETMFLERYGLDVLRLYAPVDGVELSCAPKTWSAEDIFLDIREALEANTLALKSSGKSNDYFVFENSLDKDVRFFYFKDWPYSFEVIPSQGSSLISKPVGNQPGLGILGFCYISYHFVYDLNYPILVQVYEDNEIFQFPMAVVIKGNNARESLPGNSFENENVDICSNSVSNTRVNVYDSDSNFVDAQVSFECFGSNCNLGKTENGYIEALIPECMNGYLVANAEGFKEKRMIYSSVEEGSSMIFLDKEYDLPVFLKVDGKDYSKEAIISFLSDESSSTINYPLTKEITLAEGVYEVQVYIYENSSLKFGETTREQCLDVPRNGIGGFFGVTKQECFEVEVPEQMLTQVLSGGGTSEIYVEEDTLSSSVGIELYADSLSKPKTIEELQNNYILFESKNIEVNYI